MRKLIINADDFGLSEGICRAIYELMELGAISSTTLMLAAEGAVERCLTWNIKSLIGRVGVHLQLTDGYPILPSEQIPSLVNHRTNMFLPKAELANLDPIDVEREWRAQIMMAYEILKGKPSHLDSHHGAHHYPNLSSVFIKLALEFDLPVRDCTEMNKFNPNLKLAGSDVVLYEWTARGLSSVELQQEIYTAVTNSDNNDILELVTHPGYSSEKLRTISNLNDLREKDFTSLLSFKETNWLEHNHIQLVNFCEIY